MEVPEKSVTLKRLPSPRMKTWIPTKFYLTLVLIDSSSTHNLFTISYPKLSIALYIQCQSFK
jgi:hypothetical protein